MSVANSLKTLVAPVALAVAFGGAVTDAHALDFGCRDKEQIKKELMAEGQVPVVSFYSQGGSEDYRETFLTSNVKSGSGYRMIRSEQSKNSKICVLSKLTNIKLYSPAYFNDQAFLESADHEHEYEIKGFLEWRNSSNWATKEFQLGEERMSGANISKTIKELEDPNHMKELIKSYRDKNGGSDGQAENAFISYFKYLKAKEKYEYLLYRNELNKKPITTGESRINMVLYTNWFLDREYPIFRATEYSPLFKGISTRITYVTASPVYCNGGYILTSTVDGQLLLDTTKKIPAANSQPNVDHGAELTRYAKLLLGIKDGAEQ